MAKVELYDTTLRDGTQQEGVSLSVEDKLKIARKLDELGIDFIEGGWPGANPKDAEFFHLAQSLELKHAKLAAFCSTRRANGSAETDATLRHALNANTPVVTMVGKTWDMHVTEVLETNLEENLAMISDSVAFFKGHGKTVLLDAEHFFDGFKANPEYALQCVRAASDAGPTRLCCATPTGERCRTRCRPSSAGCARRCRRRRSRSTRTTTATSRWRMRLPVCSRARRRCRAP